MVSFSERCYVTIIEAVKVETSHLLTSTLSARALNILSC